MAFCPNCGGEVSGRFCPNCGSDITAAAAGGAARPGPGPGPGAGAYVPPAPPPGSVAQAPGLTDNVASTLCYLFGFITGIIFLIISPYNHNRTVRFHAFQSIFASVALIAIEIVLGIFSTLLWAAHLGLLVGTFWLVFRLAVLIGWIYLMYMTYNNKKIVLPFVGPLAEKQA
jgi:uncharacterized membrane protein